MLYHYTNFDKTEGTPFENEPKGSLLDQVRNIRNSVSHRDMLCMSMDEKDIRDFIVELGTVVTITQTDSTNIEEHLNIIYD